MKHVRRQSVRTLTALVVTLLLLLTASIAMATDEASVTNLPAGGFQTGEFHTGDFRGGFHFGCPGGFHTGDFRGGFHFGCPGGFPGGFHGGCPGGFPGGFPGKCPGDEHDDDDGGHHHEVLHDYDRDGHTDQDDGSGNPVVIVEDVPLAVPKTGTVDNTSMAIGILLMLVSAAGVVLMNRARVSAK